VARIDVIAYTPTEVLEEEDVTVGRARELVEREGVTWVNVLDPDPRAIEELGALFSLHPLALEDASRVNTPPKVDAYGDILFVVARTIVWAEEIAMDQVSLFLGKGFVVTIEDKVVPGLEDVRVKIRRQAPRLVKSGADHLAYAILDAVVDAYFPQLDRLAEIIDGLEAALVEGPGDAKALARLHEVRSDLVHLRNALRPQRDAFATLARLELPLIRRETREYLRDVYDKTITVLDTIDTYREIVSSLMDLQATLVSNEINKVIKVLTIIFTVSLPLAIVTSAFGMNVYFPGKEEPLGLALALGMMLATTLTTALYLKRKHLW